MKRYIIPVNIGYFLLLTVVFNSYMLIKNALWALAIIIPAFLALSILPGTSPRGTKRLKWRICNHGTTVLSIFTWTLIPSLLWHVALAFLTLPENYLDLIFSTLYCILFSALFFWNGIICVYCRHRLHKIG